MIVAINADPRGFWHAPTRGECRISSVDRAQGYAPHWLAKTCNCRQFDPGDWEGEM